MKKRVESPITSHDEHSEDGDEGQGRACPWEHKKGKEQKAKMKAKYIAESTEEELDVEGPSDVDFPDEGERTRITGATYVDRLITLDAIPTYYPPPEVKEDIAYILDCSRSEVQDPGSGRLDSLLHKCVSSCNNHLLKD